MENSKSTCIRKGNEVIYTRLLHAPRELVWEAWINPEHVKNWWGPDGFTLTHKSMEVKPTGIWRFIMHGMGRDFANRIQFIEVKKPSLLVYKHMDDDNPDALTFTAYISFEEAGENTLITMRNVLPSEEVLLELDRQVNAIEGGNQHLARLDEYLSQQLKNN